MTGVGLRCLFLLVSCAAVSTATHADAQIQGLDELIIRTYDPQNLVGDRVAAASRTTDEILLQTDVAVTWRHCDLPLAAPAAVGPASQAGQTIPDDPCHLAVAANHLVVRIVAAPPTALPRALGFTYVDRSPNLSWLATIFGDRLITLADRLRQPPEVLIGRAMAHELGHLLLETPFHAKRGFMQAAWGDDLLRRNRPSDWRFTPREATSIRASVFSRSRTGSTGMLAARRALEEVGPSRQHAGSADRDERD
jgi:hypothetical protein